MNCWQRVRWLKWLKSPHFGLLPLALIPGAPWQGSSAPRVAQGNYKAQVTFFSTGRHLCPLKHPAEWLAVIFLDLREALCVSPNCATPALWTNRGFYFPELSIWYFSMLNKFTFSINKKITKKEDDKLQDDLVLKFLAAFPFLLRDQEILLQLHSARSYGNLILILKWCFQMYVLLIEEFTLIYLSYWTEKEQ